jgi:glutathione S-transferase
MLRVLGRASSINVRKVLWTCEEIGIAYAHADDGPELKRNPNGLVPVIVDGDFVLWKSNTIIRYLANKWSAHALLPIEPRRRAEVDRWFLTPFDRPSFPHVADYYERLGRRPAFLRHGRNGIA